MKKFSVSRLNKALECPRAFEYSYIHKIERNYIDTGKMSWGKLFHSAMAAALRTWYYKSRTGTVDPIDISEVIGKVCDASVASFWETVGQTNLTSEVITDMGIKIEAQAEEVARVAYRCFLDMNMGVDFDIAPYSVISAEHERFTASFSSLEELQDWINQNGVVLEDYPMIEYNFEYKMSDGNLFIGYMDVVLIDLHTNEYILADFKTTDGLSPEETAERDEFLKKQLGVYQWILRDAGLPISTTMIYQVLQKAPREPKLVNADPKGKRKRLEMRKDMATDYSTYYAAIMKHGFDPADYADMLDSVSQNKFFQRIYVRRNDRVLNLLMKEVSETIQYIQFLESKQLWPGQFNWKCNRCPFNMLCQHIQRGGELEDMIDEDMPYRSRA